MTTDEQYVPSEALLRTAWSDYCQSMDDCNAWVRPDGIDTRAEFDRFLARVRRDAKAEAWDEAYRRGVDDARIADELRVEVGLGPDLYAQPARQNPYETGGQA